MRAPPHVNRSRAVVVVVCIVRTLFIIRLKRWADSAFCNEEHPSARAMDHQHAVFVHSILVIAAFWKPKRVVIFEISDFEARWG